MAVVRRVPKVRFSEFKVEWEKKKIGDYYKSLKTGMTPYRGKQQYFQGNVPWITSGELNYNIILETKEYITSTAVSETNLKIYPPLTFFIAITGLEAPGTRGKCALNGIPATTNQSCLAFEKTLEIETLFLFYWYNKYGVS
jgi:type I restriction enzyme, S subunit